MFLLRKIRPKSLRQFQTVRKRSPIHPGNHKRWASTKSIAGIYAPVPTPFKENGDLDTTGLTATVQKLNASPLDGYVILGSNGEFPLLSTEERVSVLTAASKAVDPKKKKFAGTGTCSLRETIYLTKIAKQLEYTAALVITPYYFIGNMTGKLLEDYYTRLADAVDIPIVLYNMPPLSGVNIPVDTVGKLSKHPNIVGIKDSSNNILQCVQYTRAANNNSFELLAGSGSLLLVSLMSGAHGAIVGVGNVAPKHCTEIYTAYLQGKYQQAKDLQKELVGLNQAVTGTYGVPGLKTMMNHLGFPCGYPRSPLQPLTTADKESLLDIYRNCKIVDKGN